MIIYVILVGDLRLMKSQTLTVVHLVHFVGFFVFFCSTFNWFNFRSNNLAYNYLGQQSKPSVDEIRGVNEKILDHVILNK